MDVVSFPFLPGNAPGTRMRRPIRNVGFEEKTR
jgi:hypothetical protein